MTDALLPPNVYSLAQKDFNAIPDSPWVYWITPNLRKLFTNLMLLGDISPSLQGLATTSNFRFLRKWWETGTERIAFNCKNSEEALNSGKKWFPYMKGGNFKRWYGNQEDVVLWQKDGQEIRELVKLKYRDTSYAQGFTDERWDKLIDIWVVKNRSYYFREGITYSYLTSGNFSARLSPGGFIFDVAGSSLFPENISLLLGVMNSKPAAYLLKLINPTVNFQVGDLARLPIPAITSLALNNLVSKSFHLSIISNVQDECTFKFIIPPDWDTGQQNLARAENRLATLEAQVDDEVYKLYGIMTDDRFAIESELTGGVMDDEEEGASENNDKDIEVVEAVSAVSPQELAIRYISYAVGVGLRRFQPGRIGSLGSAIYCRSDFSIGSLPAPDEVEFDDLVGPADQFAYVDENGGRHVFSAQVERALQNLALTDGIAIFDEGHPRDLPALVEKALNLMLGEQAAREIIREATGGNSSTSLSANLRNFLEKDFFTGWHFKWYRKRPVYWPIQSSKRSYGFVLFHEKITHDTFYAIQREPYLDTKRNAVALKMADLQASLARVTGTAAKKIEKELDDLRKLSDELVEFAKELEAITMGGYEPEPNWIDDGVILRMAPLWKVIPIWKSEPKKYWERLAAGDFDWSHIAMKYWPKRVRDKCKTNKSYAIAHGHEEWYQG